MMNPELLAAVCANPADDSVRLILADWLEEHGEHERSSFIRVQCRLAEVERLITQRQFFHGLLMERDRLQALSRELLGPHREGEWGANAWKWFKSQMPAGVEFTLSRGFVASVSCTCDVWFAHGPTLVRQSPLESVWITDKKPQENTVEAWRPERNKRYWRWFTDGKNDPPRNGHPNELPQCLWAIIHQGIAGHSPLAPSSWEFTSPEAAHAALSTAALTWAQAQPLPAVTP